MDYCWAPALSIGSTFVETSLNDPNKVKQNDIFSSNKNDDYETIKFF